MSTMGWLDTRSRRARENGSVWVRLDWGLLVAALALSLIGALLIWSATRRVEGDALMIRHLVNLAIGLLLGGAVALVDYRGLRAYSPVLYVLSIIGLVVVLTPLGSTINGSHSWIVLPLGFSVQPSEFAKVALVVALALLLAEKRDADDTPRHVDVALALVVAAIPMALVMLQPDLGSVLVLAALLVGVVAASGAPARWVVGLLVVGAVGIAVGLGTNVLDTYQKDRLTAFADPSVDPRGIGYQTRQVRIAIGSGGLDGQGLFHGTQTQGGFVPYQQTDFVFSVAGEELGFLGAATILLLEGFILVRGLLIAARAEELFGRLVAVGVVCWFTFQVFENVGMNLGIMPVTGLPLPFVSYGGSSMFASWLAIGLLQNVRLGMSSRFT
ncbi:rod shape-determining protein RodA [Angustibacter luteus]|uniref:peptidoglycan glycosyltransferase n=1 Tax=Angustibacter luteus TaxID=658456 RepID=A0ABW1JKK1_9ACTN